MNIENNLELKDEYLKIFKISNKAIIPSRGSPLAAGYDLHSAMDLEIEAHGKAIIKTDLKIQVPIGTYGRIAPRSGLAAKNFIHVGAGVVDEDYRGAVNVILFNFSNETFKVNQGDRIAQLICEKIKTPKILEVYEVDFTDRNENGFGSTGIN